MNLMDLDLAILNGLFQPKRFYEGKHKPTTKANSVHGISLGGSDANARDRAFTVPANGVQTEARTVQLDR